MHFPGTAHWQAGARHFLPPRCGQEAHEKAASSQACGSAKANSWGNARGRVRGFWRVLWNTVVTEEDRGCQRKGAGGGENRKGRLSGSWLRQASFVPLPEGGWCRINRIKNRTRIFDFWFLFIYIFLPHAWHAGFRFCFSLGKKKKKKAVPSSELLSRSQCIISVFPIYGPSLAEIEAAGGNVLRRPGACICDAKERLGLSV